MPYTITRLPNHTVEISAHLEPEVVSGEQRTVLRRFQRLAQDPRCRPGRAPEGAVRARFGAEIKAELRDHLAEVVWQQVVEGEGALVPLTSPDIEKAELQPDGGFTLSARLEVRPHYELPEIVLTLPAVEVQAAADEVDAEIERLREEHASWAPAGDIEATDGVLVEADLDGALEGAADESYAEQGARFVLGREGVPAEVNEALQGARAGDVRTAERRFPDDDPDEGRAGRTVSYTISVKELKTKVLPEVDDSFAASLGLESLEELRGRVAEGLGRRKQAERRETWRRAVLDHLEAALDPADLPSTLVQSAVREDLNRFAYTLAMRGVAPDAAEVDWQQLAARFEPGARRRVLDTLVLEQLATTWNVEVPEGEVDGYVLAEAHRLGVPPGEHKANLAKEDRLDQIRHAARMSAVVDEMIRRAGGEVG